MALTKEQAEEVRKQLLSQIENVPTESREEVKKQIEAMSPEQMEEFLKKNQQLDDKEQEGCIFCKIAEGKSPSIKVDENDEAVAVMDINPISKGHVLVIPKKHGADPSEKSQELAFSVGGKILENLKPKDITTRGAKVADHTILNVVPLYEDTDLEKRMKIENNELLEIAKKIGYKEPEPIPKVGKKDSIPEPKPIEKKKEEYACLFCAIAQGQGTSFQIDENKDNIAVLELNPISKGHSIVIPKNHIETTNLPANSFTLAKKIAKKIKTKYKPNDVKINPTSMNGHGIIELVPIYNDTDVSKREKAEEEKLKEIQETLKVKRKPTTQRKSTKKKSTEKEKRPNKGTFVLPKRPKYPDLVQMSRRRL